MDCLHPGYLHELYRYDIWMKGIQANFNEIGELMNENSDVPEEARPVLCLSHLQFYWWWNINGSSEIYAKKNPLLAQEQKYKRIEWLNL